MAHLGCGRALGRRVQPIAGRANRFSPIWTTNYIREPDGVGKVVTWQRPVSVNQTKRAHFCITEQGRGVLANPPERITIQYLNQFPDDENRKPSDSETEAAESQPTDSVQESSLTPDETMRHAHSLLEQELADDLLAKRRAGTPAFFENLVVRLLFAMGYGRIGNRNQ